jgi:hypothetical protein
MRSALRHLCQHGAEALKPQKTLTQPVVVAVVARESSSPSSSPSPYIAKPSREVWRRPLVSKRVANDLRKKALRDGTYGQFDAATGTGWDPLWDRIVHSNQYTATHKNLLAPPKKIVRDRQLREDRAKRLEQNLEGQADAMEKYYTEKEQARVQDKSFEAQYKRMLRGAGAR